MSKTQRISTPKTSLKETTEAIEVAMVTEEEETEAEEEVKGETMTIRSTREIITMVTRARTTTTTWREKTRLSQTSMRVDRSSSGKRSLLDK